MRLLSLLLILLSTASCDVEQDTPITVADVGMDQQILDTDVNKTDAGDVAVSGITWHQDVRQIFERSCNGCHSPGEIGPFEFSDYDSVAPLGAIVKSAVQAEAMPPWPPSDECAPSMRHERRLSSEEIGTIVDWVDTGMALGDASKAVTGKSEIPDLIRVDHTIDIGVEYQPIPPDGGEEDYRCFIVEHDFETDQFIAAYETIPGNAEVVHHMLLFQAPNDQLAKARELEGEDINAGFTCFSNPELDDGNLVAGWVPGTVPVEFPEGTGMRVSADSFFVVQIHYNTRTSDAPDRTRINLVLTESEPRTPLQMASVREADFMIPAGASNHRTVRNIELPGPIPIYGIVPHMHNLGSRIKVTTNKGKGCLIDIQKWDFDWQGFYLFEKTQLALNDVQLECWYDNSVENQPAGQTPRDVTWGEGSRDEMCLSFFIIPEFE